MARATKSRNTAADHFYECDLAFAEACAARDATRIATATDALRLATKSFVNLAARNGISATETGPLAEYARHLKPKAFLVALLQFRGPAWDRVRAIKAQLSVGLTERAIARAQAWEGERASGKRGPWGVDDLASDLGTTRQELLGKTEVGKIAMDVTKTKYGQKPVRVSWPYRHPGFVEVWAAIRGTRKNEGAEGKKREYAPAGRRVKPGPQKR